MPDQPLRLTVLLSGSGSTFAAIHEWSKHQNSGFVIANVVSDVANAYGLERAAKAGCDTHCVEFDSFDQRSDFNQALLKAVQATSPDLVVLAGFMRIVDPFFVRAFDGKLLNIHPSLLPKYPGLNTYKRALAAFEKAHGSTVHFVNDVLDGGPLIAQAVVAIEHQDTAKTLSQRVQEAERTLYPTVIEWFAHGRLEQRDGLVWLDGTIRNKPVRGTVNPHTEEFERD
ncbi:MAG: phosphoribosylglycinamide formyltransferase [Gammaproteobacteria bacterium]